MFSVCCWGVVKKKFSLSCGVANRVADLRGLTVPTKFVVFFFFSFHSCVVRDFRNVTLACEFTKLQLVLLLLPFD